jgi:uncharacterized protein (DUF1697 family)
MTTYIALLRAVNVGGSKPVRMSALRGLLAQRGYLNVQTLLQSGNVVFESGSDSSRGLEGDLQAEISKGLDVKTEVFVRDASDWGRVLRENPFAKEAERDPSHLVVTFLKDPPTGDAWGLLQASIRGSERVHGAGRHGYIVYPKGIGRSQLTAARIESRLGTPSTSRNWNTVRKLGEMACG